MNMSKLEEQIVLVGALPPPINGQSYCFDLLKSAIEDVRYVKVVDITFRESSVFPKQLQIALKALFFVKKILSLGLLCRRSCTVYIAIAQSLVGFLRDFSFIWIARLFGRPTVLHLHGGNYFDFYNNRSVFLKAIIRLTLRQSKSIIVLSDRLKSQFNFSEDLAEHLVVVPNGIPLVEIDLNAKVFRSKGPIKVLYISNLIQSKGYLDVLRSVAVLKKSGYPITLEIAGRFQKSRDDEIDLDVNEAEKRFYQCLKHLGITDNVHYHGVVVGDAKHNLLKNAHVFVLPTNYYNEGQPMALIEALAYGTPLVSTNYRAISDMLIDGYTGAFVAYQNPNAIAEAIVSIVSSGKYSSYSQNCIEHFRKNFTIDAHIERIQQVIDNASG